MQFGRIYILHVYMQNMHRGLMTVTLQADNPIPKRIQNINLIPKEKKRIGVVKLL